MNNGEHQGSLIRTQRRNLPDSDGHEAKGRIDVLISRRRGSAPLFYEAARPCSIRPDPSPDGRSVNAPLERRLGRLKEQPPRDRLWPYGHWSQKPCRRPGSVEYRQRPACGGAPA